ncbi:MAG: hypothetical protein COU09_02520 [Candidatus Harrisonbacteria bacterium CG10_big_fil_rev_8_21_14_0_10_44_23]|uniref:DUF5671 domain-containing protein n=1 Tax=Candidatus Harrisonbacteria bacterium CG10_big_fil_rev_8_21_14_0_10_44_23 TaxID=1974585 RepID=A0A2H0UPS6_9BACT|nr:MAG: hypothetical protein COU09_02520 [Candidatus Harrisonbacteria bacterium CG10_big_fil_rev_8_21_14_0_10_44_23]
MLKTKSQKAYFLLLLLPLLLLCFTPLALSATSTDETIELYAPLPGGPDTVSSASGGNLGTYLNTLYKFSIGVGAFLAMAIIVIAGIRYITEQGKPFAQSEAKSWIVNAVLGLILLLSAALIIGTLNSGFLNISGPGAVIEEMRKEAANNRAQRKESDEEKRRRWWEEEQKLMDQLAEANAALDEASEVGEYNQRLDEITQTRGEIAQAIQEDPRLKADFESHAKEILAAAYEVEEWSTNGWLMKNEAEFKASGVWDAIGASITDDGIYTYNGNPDISRAAAIISAEYKYRNDSPVARFGVQSAKEVVFRHYPQTWTEYKRLTEEMDFESIYDWE